MIKIEKDSEVQGLKTEYKAKINARVKFEEKITKYYADNSKPPKLVFTQADTIITSNIDALNSAIIEQLGGKETCKGKIYSRFLRSRIYNDSFFRTKVDKALMESFKTTEEPLSAIARILDFDINDLKRNRTKIR
ncbi:MULTISPECIES: hypothetical protein [unclassified Endozoicomonas]|uniref:hypothetical protein n=1 Tax=unclassified Endozoicomonas TaxID=2644528 RepID=UPI002147CE4F|nr:MULTISPECIES: hypothetical protein [unclassified Endozoicomonas]